MLILNWTPAFRISFRMISSAALVMLASGPTGAQSVAQRLERLERRVDQLEADSQFLYLDVQCNSGQTVAAALARANTRSGPVTIAVNGNCQEGGLIIGRDDITLRGATPGSGITGPGGRGSSILSVQGAQRLRLEDLTLTTLMGGGFGIIASNGASRRERRGGP